MSESSLNSNSPLLNAIEESREAIGGPASSPPPQFFTVVAVDKNGKQSLLVIEEEKRAKMYEEVLRDLKYGELSFDRVKQLQNKSYQLLRTMHLSRTHHALVDKEDFKEVQEERSRYEDRLMMVFRFSFFSYFAWHSMVSIRVKILALSRNNSIPRFLSKFLLYPTIATIAVNQGILRHTLCKPKDLLQRYDNQSPEYRRFYESVVLTQQPGKV